MHRIAIIDVETGKESGLDAVDKNKRSKTEARKDQLLSYFLYGRLRNDFYSDILSPDSLFIDTIIEFANGTDKDILYLSKCMVYASEKSLRKDLVVVALVILSMSSTDYGKKKFRVLFPKLIKNPKDLQLFLFIIKSKSFRGCGKIIREVLADWLNSCSISMLTGLLVFPGSLRTSQPLVKDFNLKDLLCFSHAKGSTIKKQAIFDYAVSHKISKNLPSIFPATRELFSTRTTQAKYNELISNNNFFFFPNKTPTSQVAWNSLFQSTGIERALPDLMKFEKEVFKVRENSNLLWSVLSDKEKVMKMKFNPFDYAKLYDEYSARSSSQSEEVKVALKIAMENSYENLKSYDKTAIIIVDQSLTTKTHQTIENGVFDSTVLSTYAAIFSRMFKKSYIVPFDAAAQVIEDLPKDTISRSDYITYSMKGFERDYNTPFTQIKEKNLKCNVLIALTANNSWFNVLRNTAAGDYLSQYINVVNIPEKLFFVSANDSYLVSENHNLHNSHFLYGTTGMYEFIELQLDQDHKKNIQAIEF